MALQKLLSKFFNEAKNEESLNVKVKDSIEKRKNIILEAIEQAKSDRKELMKAKDAYKQIACQLAMMANNAGFLWHKDAKGRFLFASHEWCEYFWRDSVCDVEGFTDIELAEKFMKRFPTGTFTFGQSICIGSDQYTINEGCRCRFIEIGYVKTSPDDDRGEVIIMTDKTPLYDGNGKLQGTVGMAMQISRGVLDSNMLYWNKAGAVKKISDALYVILKYDECVAPIVGGCNV